MRLVASLVKRLSLSWPSDQLPCARTGNAGRQSVPFGTRSHWVGSMAPVCRVPEFPDIGNFDLPGAVAEDTRLRIARRPVIQCGDVASLPSDVSRGDGLPDHLQARLNMLDQR